LIYIVIGSSKLDSRCQFKKLVEESPGVESYAPPSGVKGKAAVGNAHRSQG